MSEKVICDFCGQGMTGIKKHKQRYSVLVSNVVTDATVVDMDAYPQCKERVVKSLGRLQKK